jgi:uncharacterized protein involved in tolerance to divalent cations
MINVYIAHPNESTARKLAEDLLKNQMVARLSVDYNNHVFEMIEDEIRESTISLITAQTKALLFTDIVAYVHVRYGKNIPIYSLPMTQVNEDLSHLIREKTLKA